MPAIRYFMRENINRGLMEIFVPHNKPDLAEVVRGLKRYNKTHSPIRIVHSNGDKVHYVFGAPLKGLSEDDDLLFKATKQRKGVCFEYNPGDSLIEAYLTDFIKNEYLRY